MFASMIFRKEPFFHGHDNYDQVCGADTVPYTASQKYRAVIVSSTAVSNVAQFSVFHVHNALSVFYQPAPGAVVFC